MKRPMCVLGATMLLGTWMAFWFSARQAMLLSAASLVTGLLVAALRRSRLRGLCAVLLTMAVAFALHARYEQTRLQPFARMDGQVVPASALVTEARLAGRTIRYTLYAVFPEHPELPPAAVHLRAYGEMDYVAGDVLQCDLRLAPREQPDRGMRHAADDYVDAFLEGTPQRVQQGFAARRRLLRLREGLRGNVYDSLHPATADVVCAMVLGMRDNLAHETYTAVNRAGTAHLLAISGLHLSIVAAMLGRVLGGLPLSRRAKALLTVLGVLLFAILVGFSASIMRAGIMVSVGLLANGLGRRRGDSLSALGFSAAVICLVWPDWVVGKALWLSAGATLGIILYAEKLRSLLYSRLEGRGKLYNRLVRVLCVSLGVSLAASAFTLPLLVLFSGWVSLVAPLSNLLVAPFVPVVILGGMLCAALGPAGPALRLLAVLTDACTAMVLQLSAAMAALPFATLSVDQGWMLLWLAFAALAAAVLAAFRADRRLMGYAAALLVLTASFGQLAGRYADRDRVELAVVEGCEAAVLLRDGEAVILGTPQVYEINGLLRYLEYRGVHRVRAVLATDHGEQVGSALPRLARRYPVDCVIGPDDAYILGQLALALPEVPVYSGGYATLELLGGVRVEVIPPSGDLYIRTGRNTILKSSTEYGIIEDDSYTIALYPDGMLVLNGARGQDSNPLGELLYGERRWTDSAC